MNNLAEGRRFSLLTEDTIIYTLRQYINLFNGGSALPPSSMFLIIDPWRSVRKILIPLGN